MYLYIHVRRRVYTLATFWIVKMCLTDTMGYTFVVPMRYIDTHILITKRTGLHANTGDCIKKRVQLHDVTTSSSVTKMSDLPPAKRRFHFEFDFGLKNNTVLVVDLHTTWIRRNFKRLGKGTRLDDYILRKMIDFIFMHSCGFGRHHIFRQTECWFWY